MHLQKTYQKYALKTFTSQTQTPKNKNLYRIIFILVTFRRNMKMPNLFKNLEPYMPICIDIGFYYIFGEKMIAPSKIILNLICRPVIRGVAFFLSSL